MQGQDLFSTMGHGELLLQNLFPRRATKDREELLLQNCHCYTFFHEGPLRTAKNCYCNYHCYTFFHGGPLRATENCYCRTATATPFVREGPRRAAKNCYGNYHCYTFCPRRAATKTLSRAYSVCLLSEAGFSGLLLQVLVGIGVICWAFAGWLSSVGRIRDLVGRVRSLAHKPVWGHQGG